MVIIGNFVLYGLLVDGLMFIGLVELKYELRLFMLIMKKWLVLSGLFGLIMLFY